MEPIITSILDNDMYKFTMQQAVLEIFPEAIVTYRFKNRGKQRFNVRFLELLKQQIEYMGLLSLTQQEYSHIKGNIPFFKPAYVEYLKNYRYKDKKGIYRLVPLLVSGITKSGETGKLWMGIDPIDGSVQDLDIKQSLLKLFQTWLMNTKHLWLEN